MPVLSTLYGKLTAILLVLFGFIAVLYVELTLFTTRRHIQEVNQKLNQHLAERLVSEQILMREGRVNEEVLEDVFHSLMIINPSIELYLLGPEGDILAFSAPPGIVKRDRVSLEPIRRFLSDSDRLPILGDDPRDWSRQKVFSVSPIPLESGSPPSTLGPAVTRAETASRDLPYQGFLYIVLGGEEYDSVADMLRTSYILRLSTGIVAGSLACALIGSLFLVRLLTRRLHHLAGAMDRFRRTQLQEDTEPSSRASPRQGDEIDELTASFEEMARRIAKQVDAIQENDRLRRELVANVSHDLRTPLATLHGYLETLLLKDGLLDARERRRYLEVATKHSNRLGKLVSELFELAKLDAHEVRLELEPFLLGELVQDVVQEFQLAADQKKIRLRTDFSRELPLVRADIGLIERVLENLIENALRYTPEHGSVTVGIRTVNGELSVQVEDTGCGIPSEELSHIFDRFYRVTMKNAGQPEGAGLGLAITKRILELHGSSIRAESTLGVGTALTFRLPVIMPSHP